MKGSGPFVWRASPLPPWLSLDAHTGELSGIATWRGQGGGGEEGEVAIEVQVSNEVGGSRVMHRVVLVKGARVCVCVIDLFSGARMPHVRVSALSLSTGLF